MPQGRHKKPFSGKQKKEQLKEKKDQQREERARSRSTHPSESCDDDHNTAAGETFYSKHRRGRTDSKNRLAMTELGDDGLTTTVSGLTAGAIAKINAQPDTSNRRDANRYALHFFRESDAELSKRKKEASEPFERIPPEIGLEVKSEDVWPPIGLGMPKRPEWDFRMSPEQLDMRENKYFREYLEAVEKEYECLTNISHFELNLETWRQLWRVIEMADIILLVADIRHPIFHFPPELFHYVTIDLKKSFIIVLNKCDLIPANLVVAWIDYFKQKYPLLHVVPFASYAGMKIKISSTGSKSNKTATSKRIGSLKMSGESCRRLYRVVHEIAKKESIDISSWNEKIESESKSSDDSSDTEEPEPTEHKIVKKDLSFHQHKSFKDGIVTIGCVGHPNVGKSSVLNAIMGKKVVSVSRTPGHTKYFQTIFITPNVKLVDCPGLVFPSKIPKPMQVLMGCFPIAQLREPYSAILFMAQRIDMPKILKIKHPDPDPNVSEEYQKWTAFDMCEAWAAKRGFKTAKAARPDVYRAANHLLRMALDGRTLCLSFYPEDYVQRRDRDWVSHPDVNSILILQNLMEKKEDEEYLPSEDDDEEEPSVYHDAEEDLPRASKSTSSKPGSKSSKSSKAIVGEGDGESEGEDIRPSRSKAKGGKSVLNRFALLADDD